MIPRQLKFWRWGPVRTASGHFRARPGFIVIGAKRAGSTTLFRLIAQHPACHTPTRQEVHYFDLSYSRGMAWYRSHFPFRIGGGERRDSEPVNWITGEGSAFYMCDPRVPRRIEADLPGVKLLCVVSDPVRRAWSHYLQNTKKGRPDELPFEEAVRAEEERIGPEWQRMVSDETYISRKWQHLSYVARGLYAKDLRRWFDVFGKDGVLVVRGEDLMYGDAAGAMREVYDFLGLEPFESLQVKEFDKDFLGEIPPGACDWLRDRFRGPNRELSEIIGRDVDWD